MIGGNAQRRVNGAVRHARQVVGGGHVIDHALQAQQLNRENIGSLIENAEGNQGKTSFPVTSGVVAGIALTACPVEGNINLAVGDHGPACFSQWGQLIVGSTDSAVGNNSGVVAGNVGETILDVWEAASGILSKMIPAEANLAQVLVTDVCQAVGDVDQAEVSVDGQSWKVNVALDAKAEAVVLETVTDASWHAS